MDRGAWQAPWGHKSRTKLSDSVLLLVYIWYISGSFHVCSRISQAKWIQSKRPTGRALLDFPFDRPSVCLCTCGQGGLLTLGRRNMWSGQGPTSSLNCPAVLLEFQSIGNESPITLPQDKVFFLLPQYVNLKGEFRYLQRCPQVVDSNQSFIYLPYFLFYHLSLLS